MTCDPPSPKEQITFLQDLQRLLEEGSFTTTYKYALLRALADLALERGDDTGDPLALHLDQIAQKVIELYWLQARPFPSGDTAVPLRQITDRRRTIVDRIQEVRESNDANLAALKGKRKAWKKILESTRRTLARYPLQLLQQVGGEELAFLYDTEIQDGCVILKQGVGFCFRRFHPLVRDIVETAWARFVRRTNLEVLGESTDLRTFLFGEGRSPLSVYQPILDEYQGGRCFYCEGTLHGSIDVDHFIPWSKYPTDLGHNFVLAHPSCNRSKAAHLAWEVGLERWMQRNLRHGHKLGDAFSQKGILHDVGATTNIARWAYAQTHAAGGQVWIPGGELRSLADSWKASFLPPPAAPGQDLLGPEDGAAARERVAEEDLEPRDPERPS